ncbi:hypothetical protein [Parasphingorhabdus sp.]|uniref:hypothetical protein n=2 Tax=Parasphingorhabdus sp. TaxID=2709688 RepID=UPI00309CAEE1
MNIGMLYIGCFMLVGFVLFHGVMGQRILISPLLQQRVDMMNETMPRTMIQFGWQVGTVLTLLPALYLFLVASGEIGGSAPMVLAIGLSFVGMGLANVALIRLKHPGWFVLTATGITILTSLYI